MTRQECYVETWNAVHAGLLTPPDACELCQGPPPPFKGLVRHHEDYARPLYIKWLCPSCHSRIHGWKNAGTFGKRIFERGVDWDKGGSQVKLRDVVPNEFFVESMDSPAAQHLDVEITSRMKGGWPGPQNNVHVWWKLLNGKAVGWNENPARGWSFPVIRCK